MSDLTTETARAMSEGRMDDALVLANACAQIQSMRAEWKARRIAYYTERFLNCQARGTDLRDVEAPPEGWEAPVEPEPTPETCDVPVGPDPMKCCPGKWKHDPECVPCRYCFAGTQRYRGDVPICGDCQQNQAVDDYQMRTARIVGR